MLGTAASDHVVAVAVACVVAGLAAGLLAMRIRGRR
jgi:hypothetical protein